MHTVEIEISDELAEVLVPHTDKLPMLLELGLQEWLRHRSGEHAASRERIREVVAASGKVKMPEPYTAERPYVRRTPVSVSGKPVSEVVLEQRAPR